MIRLAQMAGLSLAFGAKTDGQLHKATGPLS
jgi:hypothetical protein